MVRFNWNGSKEKASIFSQQKYSPVFPHSSLAFCSGASGNLCYQSLKALWGKRAMVFDRTIDIYTKECFGTNVVYAGIITSSYMFFIEKMGCGDFSYSFHMIRRYLGGYCAGVTAVSFLSFCDFISQCVRNKRICSTHECGIQFYRKLLTVCPLIMIQQAGYDHLRIITDPFISPSVPLFFVTGFVTGIMGQLLIQPFINFFQDDFSFSFSSLWKGSLHSCFNTALMMGICLSIRDVILGRLSSSDYRLRCERRSVLNKLIEE